jgi:hypothetical protein
MCAEPGPDRRACLLIAVLWVWVWRRCRVLLSRTTHSLRGLTSTIGCLTYLLCSLESHVARGMLRPNGAASPGLPMPKGVLFCEDRGVLEQLGSPRVDGRRVLGHIVSTSSWGVRHARPHLSAYSYYVLNLLGPLTPAAARCVNRHQLVPGCHPARAGQVSMAIMAVGSSDYGERRPPQGATRAARSARVAKLAPRVRSSSRPADGAKVAHCFGFSWPLAP